MAEPSFRSGGCYSGCMATRFSLTAVYEPVEHGWVQARIAELPAVITAAPTLQEAKALLADALREYLLSLAAPPAPQLPPNGAVQREPLEIVIDAAAPHRGRSTRVSR